MTQTVFGPGICYVTRTDIANSTPINIGKAQSFSLDFKGTIKQLYGQEQYPLDAARGTIKPTGKMTAALISGTAWTSTFFSDTMATGGIQWNLNEAHPIPAISPYTVTVTNSTTFDLDLGVVYAATNLPLIKVASGPTLGQYSEAAGVYTFASADEGAATLITYTSTVTTGQHLTISNHLLGTSPTFQLDYYSSRNNKPLILRLFQCQSDSLSIGAKLEDFMMPEFGFELFANAADLIATVYFPEVN